MSSLIIKNGRVIDPASKRDQVGDVFIAVHMAVLYPCAGGPPEHVTTPLE